MGRITMDSIKQNLSFNAPQHDTFSGKPYAEVDFNTLKEIRIDLQQYDTYEDYVKSFEYLPEE
jgi:hypothetical protein